MIVAAALTLALMVLTALFYVGAIYSAGFLEIPAQEHETPLTLLGSAILFLPVTFMIRAARKNRITWRGLAAGWLVTAPVFAWLAWDAPRMLRPLTLEEISPAFEGAERSHTAILEYGAHQSTDEAQAFASVQWKVAQVRGSPREAEKWIEFITSHREGLEADWISAAPQRAWLDRLGAFNQLGDLTPASVVPELPSYQIWRFLSQRICARASLQALDGQGDAAVATLLPVLETGRKLETSARTVVRVMIARAVQKMCYETAEFILDRSNPGATARQRLLTILKDGNAAAGARRLILAEYALFAAAIADAPPDQAASLLSAGRIGPLPKPLAWLALFFFNPHATANLYGDYAYEVASLAERRDLGGFAACKNAFIKTRLQDGGMKNLGGRMLVNMAIPGFDKILKSYWEIEDLRAALQARLQAPSS